MVCMKKVCFLFCLTLCLVKVSSQEYPVINVVNSVGKYQRVYCSDLFSSIELIPLETSDKCLLREDNLRVLLNDSVIVIADNASGPTSFMADISDCKLYAFDRTGKYKNEIGRTGQGPGEYTYLSEVFFNMEKPTIFIDNNQKILEYDYHGKFIRSFSKPRPSYKLLSKIGYAGKDLFVGFAMYDGTNRFNYCIFNQNGDTVKIFPNYIFFNRGSFANTAFTGLAPFRVADRTYLKNNANDTLYVLNDLDLQPAYVFSFGKYSISKEDFEIQGNVAKKISMSRLIGMPNYFFYTMNFPETLSGPKSKPEYSRALEQYVSNDRRRIYGLYDIAKKTNILLDTDNHLQKGIVNDMNGGLPFIPLYYAGNNTVIGIWTVTDMQEMLTDDYFAKQTIKDPQAHQKLKEILRNLKYDDNPIVVVAKLK